MANHYQQRPTVTPPHVSIRTLRRASKLTQDQVCARIGEYTGTDFSRGSLSAIESGLRGASNKIIEALAYAYDIDPTDIDTSYEPRRRGVAA